MTSIATQAPSAEKKDRTTENNHETDLNTAREIIKTLTSTINYSLSIDNLIEKQFSNFLLHCTTEYATIAAPQIIWAKNSRPLPILASANSALLYFAPSAYIYPRFQTSTIRKPTLVAVSLRTQHLLQAIAQHASHAPRPTKLAPTSNNLWFSTETLHISHILIHCASQHLHHSPLAKHRALINHARYLPQLVSEDDMLIQSDHAEMSMVMTNVLNKICAPSRDCSTSRFYINDSLDTWKEEIDGTLLTTRIFDSLIEFSENWDGDSVAHLLEAAHTFILKNKEAPNPPNSNLLLKAESKRDLQHFCRLETCREKLIYSARAFARSTMCKGIPPKHLALCSRLVSLTARQTKALDSIIASI